jgi:cellobiose dehydrogenase (acceptor)
VLNTLVSSVKRNGSTVLGVQTDNHSIGPYGFVPLTATGRVVLSSGSFGSPRILFQSGIGPRAQLDIVRSNVAASSQLPSESDYIINEEVGRNVQDNPSINLMFTHPSVDSYDNWAPIWDDPREEDKQLYRQYRAGVFASSSPRMNFWKAIVGADNVTRYVSHILLFYCSLV